MSPPTADHNRILMLAARQVLKPMGIRQKGRSRLWFDDHGWWLILIEFQPSAWSKGAYLNVGFQHLWCSSGHFSFGAVERLTVDGEQFLAFDESKSEVLQEGALRLAEAARQAVESRRESHADGTESVQRMAQTEAESIYEIYDAGVALGLLGKNGDANERFDKILAVDAGTSDWLTDLHGQARTLAATVDDSAAYESEVHRRVESTRETLRLEPWNGRILT